MASRRCFTIDMQIIHVGRLYRPDGSNAELTLE